MVRSLGFGFNATNLLMSFVDLLSLRLVVLSFACNSNSLTHYAKGTSSGLWTLRLLVSIRFQDLFHYPVRVSVSPFPHGTSSLSVVTRCLGLEGGSPIFGRAYHGSSYFRTQQNVVMGGLLPC